MLRCVCVLCRLGRLARLLDKQIRDSDSAAATGGAGKSWGDGLGVGKSTGADEVDEIVARGADVDGGVVRTDGSTNRRNGGAGERDVDKGASDADVTCIAGWSKVGPACRREAHRRSRCR